MVRDWRCVLMRNIGMWASNILKTIVDTFNRTDTTTSLGTSSSGSVWSAIRGTWFVNTNKGKSTDTATTYPIAGFNASSANVTVNLDVDTNGGTGIAFWVTDSSNWWGVFPNTATAYSSSCSAYGQGSSTSCVSWYSTSSGGGCASYSSYTPYSSVCNSYTLGYNPAGGSWYQSCNGYTSQAGSTSYACTSNYPTTYSQVCGGSSTSYYSYCGAYTQTSSASGTTLRLIKSVANTVSTVLDSALASLPASLRLTTSGNSITAKAYSGAGQTTQIGSDVTSTQTAGGTTHGIILAPGGYYQGTTVDNLSISK